MKLNEMNGAGGWDSFQPGSGMAMDIGENIKVDELDINDIADMCKLWDDWMQILEVGIKIGIVFQIN